MTFNTMTDEVLEEDGGFPGTGNSGAKHRIVIRGTPYCFQFSAFQPLS